MNQNITNSFLWINRHKKILNLPSQTNIKIKFQNYFICNSTKTGILFDKFKKNAEI